MNTVLKKYISYLIPTVLASLATVFYLLFDAFFIGQGVGEVALGAVNITSPLFSISLGIGLLLGVGSSTFIQTAKGQGLDEKIGEYYKNSVFVAVVSSIILFTFSNIFIEELAFLLGANDQNIEFVLPYLRYITLMTPLMVFSPLLQTLVRASGKPKIPMVALLISGITNVVLDYLFIMVFDMGTAGAGLATFLASLFSMIYIVRYFLPSKKMLYKFSGKINFNSLKEIFKLGFPSLGYELGIGVTTYLLNVSLSSNTLAISSYSVISYVSIIILNFYLGTTNSVQSLFSYNYGLKNYDENIKLLKYSFITILTIFVTGYIVIVTNPTTVINIFTDASPEMIEVGSNGLRLYSNMYLFAGINMLLVTFLQSYHKKTFSNIATILRGSSLIFIVLPIMNYFLGIDGIWLTLAVVEFISLIIILFFFFNTIKKSKKENL